MEECILKWQNVLVVAYSNDNQSMGLFTRETNMLRTFVTALPQNILRTLTQKSLQQQSNTIAIIKNTL